MLMGAGHYERAACPLQQHPTQPPPPMQGVFALLRLRMHGGRAERGAGNYEEARYIAQTTFELLI